jgi:putative tricarboxylic transport membrane protein
MRNALSIGEGHWRIFIDRPMSLTLLGVVLAVLLVPRVLAGIEKSRAKHALPAKA